MTVGVCTTAVILAVILLPLTGSADIDYQRAWNGESPDAEILFDIRLPRVLLSLLVGGALSLSGVLFQALLRDALATPYTLGVSAGASLGAVAAICFGFPWIWAASILGAGGTLFLVLGAGVRGRRLSSFTLLMAGVTMNSICMALILFLHNLSTLTESFAISRWLMGGIDPVSYTSLLWLSLVVAGCSAVLFAQAREWNLLSVSEEWAALRGVAPARLILAGYVIGSALAGVVTSFTGPIGFVGLIVPHALRMIVGPDHRVLLPASLLVGGAFVAVCDTISRTAMAPAEIPVGVITAMLGGPFFIWLLRRR